MGAFNVYRGVILQLKHFLTELSNGQLLNVNVLMKKVNWSHSWMFTCTSVTHCVCNFGFSGYCAQLKGVLVNFHYC